MSNAQLAAQTDICVKCGLCLPQCPTYLKTQDENESPRGRLSLIQGWARDELKATPKLTGHVDNCLLCRTCESVCPAYVPYGQIIDRFRAATHGQANALPLTRRLKKAAMRLSLTSATFAPLSGRLMSGPLAGGLKSMARLAGAGDLTAGLPAPAPALPEPGLHAPDGKISINEHQLPLPPGEGWGEGISNESLPAHPSITGTVALFLGCTANLADRETAWSALRVLNRLGYAVHIPAGQTCCGALHQHAGEPETAASHIGRNLEAFGADAETPILNFASGCGVMLSEYDRDDATETTRQFSRRVHDLSQFLAGLDWPEDLALRPLPATVALHTPCSLRNVLRAEAPPLKLLRRIPELKVVSLSASTRCCGAAGSYMLDHPEMAATLRADLLDLIQAAAPACLVTSNPGCALHLRAGLRERGLGHVEVLHPVTLLARQLP